jgi:uncharacterized membrane protein
MFAAAGGASGALLIVLGNVSLQQYHKGSLCKAATFASLMISVALTVVMYKRYNDTGKLFPAAILMVLSAVMALFYVWNLAAGPKAPDRSAARKKAN